VTLTRPAALSRLGRLVPLRRATSSDRTGGIVALVPAIDVDGPRVRLGLLWAGITVLAVGIGPFTTALVFAVVALGAAGQSCRTWGAAERGRQPYRPIAVAGATVCALAGGAGPLAVVAAATVATVAAVTAQQLRFGGREWDARTTIAIAVLIGAGAATPAIAVDQLGLVPALVLLGLVHAVDASTFIVGSGAASRWEGPVAGAASAGAIGLAVAAVFVPPFRGASPWVLAAAVALLVPLGGMVGSTLLGPGRRRKGRERPVAGPVPALRRHDALFVAGPVWELLARLLLDLG
jgi:hypothetical protein